MNYSATFDLFSTITKSSHRDYFDLHRMQINIYRTIVELRTLTTDTKLFTTLWIVQNDTRTALNEILALSPWEQWMCAAPWWANITTDSTVCGMLTKPSQIMMNQTLVKQGVTKVHTPAPPGQKEWCKIIEMWWRYALLGQLKRGGKEKSILRNPIHN